jgi:hypothetical protein
MLVSLGVTVIIVDNLVEEGSESVVGVVGASINTNTGVGPFAARENCLLEGESKLILGVLKLLPNLGSEALRQEGVGACGEVGEVSNFLRALKVRTDESSSGASFSKLYKIWKLCSHKRISLQC